MMEKASAIFDEVLAATTKTESTIEKICVLRDISTEMAKAGMYEKAISVAREIDDIGIKSNVPEVKSEALASEAHMLETIAVEMAARMKK